MMSSNPSPKFKNPLTQSTEGRGSSQPPDRADLAASTLPVTVPTQPHLTAFEQSHVRMTIWVDRALKARLDALVSQQGRVSRSRLLNEAIADLLRKYKAR